VPDEHWWNGRAGDDEEPAELTAWARAQPSLAAAWAAAPRADWLLRLGRRAGLGDARALTAAACVVARVGGRPNPPVLGAAAFKSGQPFEDRAEALAGGLRAVLIAVAACAPLYLVLRGHGRVLQLAVVALVYFAVLAAAMAAGRALRRRLVARAAAQLDEAGALDVALTAATRATDAASPGERAAALKVARALLPAPLA
jgi:hypothetical protein